MLRASCGTHFHFLGHFFDHCSAPLFGHLASIPFGRTARLLLFSAIGFHENGSCLSGIQLCWTPKQSRSTISPECIKSSLLPARASSKRRAAAQPARQEAQAQRGTSNKLGLAALERRARAKQSSASRTHSCRRNVLCECDSVKGAAISLGSIFVGLHNKSVHLLRVAAHCCVIHPSANSKSRCVTCNIPDTSNRLIAKQSCAHAKLTWLRTPDLCICPGPHNTPNSNLLQT